MNFATMVTELQTRGQMADDATRAGVYINAARAYLDSIHLWPYRQTSTTGTAPVSVTDLGTIEAVTNEAQNYPLQPGDVRTLLEENGDITLSGLPQWFYVTTQIIAFTAVPSVATFPTNSDTLKVRYWKVCPDLTGTDTPLAPARFHMLYVDLAQQRAFIDRENMDAARALQPWIDQQVASMIDQLLGGQQVVGPQIRQQLSYGASDW